MIASEERVLLEGLPDTKQQLIENNIGLIYDIAKRIGRAKHIDLEDLVHEGVRAVAESIDSGKFDISRGYRWLTYAGTVAYRAMVKYAVSYRSAITVPCYAMSRRNAEKRDQAYSVSSIHGGCDTAAAIHSTETAVDGVGEAYVDAKLDAAAILHLSVKRQIIGKTERNILVRRCHGETLTEIGDSIGLCKERVRQIEQSAIERLQRAFDR